MALSWRDLATRFSVDREPHPRPPAHIQRLEAYSPVSSLDAIREHGAGYEPLKLDWNEATVAPSPRAQQALLAALSGQLSLQWYPDIATRELRQELSTYTGLPDDHLIVTNGSDDALALVCRTYLNDHTEVLAPVPTYTHFFVYVGAQNARLVELAEPDPFRKNIRHIERSITARTRLVYLVSPNNPTGQVWTEEEVRALCARFPHVLFLVDEAYHEFSGRSVIHLTQSYSNLVVTRTFSKAFGLAALRIGYLAAHPRLVDHMLRLHNTKSVNALAQIAATEALRDREHLAGYVAEVRAAQSETVSRLLDLGFEARETPANFFNLRVPDPKAFVRALERRNVYVRDRSSMPRMAGFVRVSVGTRAQMADVLERMIDAFAELRWIQGQ